MATQDTHSVKRFVIIMTFHKNVKERDRGEKKRILICFECQYFSAEVEPLFLSPGLYTQSCTAVTNNSFMSFFKVEDAPKKKSAPAEKKKVKKNGGDLEMMDVE